MASDPCWNVPWLADLAELPPGVAWPRFMTAPHPAAVGSYGPEAVRWIEQRTGRTLWWHQRLIVVRALEHDAQGRLCWREVGLSLPRQFGKSTLAGAVCSWRVEQGDRFGEPQDVLHISKDLALSMDVQRPHRARARQDPSRYRVREANGQVGIELLADGSRYQLRSPEGVFGQSVSMALIDEAWAVGSDVLDVHVLPTLMQRRDPQVWITSTANRRATALVLGRRAAGLASLESPGSLLWIEWSAPADADVTDPAVWHEYCPMMTPAIEADMAGALASALASRTGDVTVDPVDGFAVQRLNMWLDRVEPLRKGEPLVDLERWAAVEEDVTTDSLVMAIEENDAGAVLAAVGWINDGTDVGIEVRSYETRREAFAAADWLLNHPERPGSRLVVGASLGPDPAAGELGATIAGSRETPAALALFRSWFSEGRLRHWHAELLTAQLGQARVVRNVSGNLAFVAGTRTDAIRAVGWALLALQDAPVPAIY